MTHFQNIISYFKECYQADNRAISLSNFLGSKVEHQLMLNSAELIEGKLIQYPIHTEWAKKAIKTLQIYAKEKDLYCGAIFLLDKKKVLGRIQNICAPLLLFPLRIFEENEIFYLEIDGGSSILNPSFVNNLKLKDEESVGLNDYILKNIPEGFINFEAMHKIEEILGQTFPQLDLSPLALFPKVHSVSKIKQTLKDLQKPTIIPACGLGILKKSNIARGILNELNEIANDEKASAVLKDLFFQKENKSKFKPFSKQIFVPANLSNAQEKIIHSSEVYTNTLVIGPPGTGKSFTIAAIAIDAISKGKSVLIVSKNNQALDVIAKKIEQDFGFEDLCIRGGNRDYKRFLKNKIENILNGIGLVKKSKREMVIQRKNIVNYQNQIKKIEKIAVQREKDEVEYIQFSQNTDSSFFQWIKQKFIERRLKGAIPYWAIINELQEKLTTKSKLLKRYVGDVLNANIHYAVTHYRNSFQDLLVALRARTGIKKETFFDTVNFTVLLKAFPVWLVSAHDIYLFLPLRKELFDLVIIDEATQCDIASSLALLYRAKRAVVVGDPKQLRHISFLSRKKQADIGNKLNLALVDTFLLNYRENSILDIVSHAIKNQSQVLFLDEHYRSLPDIIHFSNTYFYDNALKIMTLTPHQLGKKNVHLKVCKGKREKRGYNRIEADEIIKEVLKIIENESTLEAQFSQSIGILSPFREQVNHLRNKVDKHLDINQLQKHNILVGTPFTFQGEERDIMFISFTIDEEVHPSVFIYLNREDVFNVGITRARVQQKIFISIPPQKLNKKHLLAKYLDDVNRNVGILNELPTTLVPQIEDAFLKEVIIALKNKGIVEIYPEYQIAGTEIDILFVFENKTVCVDLVGYPGVYQESFGIERYKMLFRIGIKIVVLPYRTWLEAREDCIQILLE